MPETPKTPHDPQAAPFSRLHNAVHLGRFRASARPLQDLDTWSHHTETAFFEERRAERTKHRPSDRPFADLPPGNDALPPPAEDA